MEEIVGRFFAQATRTAHRKRGSIHLVIDGKTRRRNHPFGGNGRGAFAGGLPAETRRGVGSDECRAQGE